jgi:hypothetical protein
MVRMINSLGDRMLGLVAPKAKASAAACTPGSTWWGSFCYCSGIRPYYYFCQCNSAGTGYTCNCRYRNGIGTC